MILTPFEVSVSALEARPTAADTGRTTGRGTVHLTDVIHALEGLMGKKPLPPDPTGTWEHAADIGFWFEDAIRQGVRGAYTATATTDIMVPGEVALDGVVGTPDGVEWTADGPVIWEFKATWRSIRTSPIDSRWDWRTQVMGYCHMVGAVEARLVACYLCGDYHPPAPVITGMSMVFDEKELEDNWRMVVGGAQWVRTHQRDRAVYLREDI